MRFVKMHGIGNDYVYVNGFEQTIDDPAALARRVADRHLGIGGDGLILVAAGAGGHAGTISPLAFVAETRKWFDGPIALSGAIGNGKAIALGEPEGIVKTVFDEKTGELLGAHMIGTEVTELIQGYVVAQTLETTENELVHTIFPHPTLSEMMHESVLDAYDKVIHF